MEEKKEDSHGTDSSPAIRSLHCFPILMHPLVRDLYKRALTVGKDYPLGLDYVRKTWKNAIHNPENCPSCYPPTSTLDNSTHAIDCEKEIRKAVGKGRYMIREMVGVIQLKKYRTLKKRYDQNYTDFQNPDTGRPK